MAEAPVRVLIQGRWVMVDARVNPALEVSGELAVGAFALVSGWVESAAGPDRARRPWKRRGDRRPSARRPAVLPEAA